MNQRQIKLGEDMLKCQFEKDKQTLICKFSVRMDSENSPAAALMIDEKLEELLNKNEIQISAENSNKFENLKIIFNLQNVNFVSSAFMKICIIFTNKVQPESFSIINTHPFIKKTFKIAGLDNMMEIL